MYHYTETTPFGTVTELYGTIFEWVKSSGTFTVLANFNGTNGAGLNSDLVEDSNGNLFGTAIG